ncbi:MAG: hypothetical protein AMK72_13160, partial [Planctomycetes bacterium SM23_25]
MTHETARGKVAPAPDAWVRPNGKGIAMITIGIASDNFRHEDRSLRYVFAWCRDQGCDTVEINT